MKRVKMFFAFVAIFACVVSAAAWSGSTIEPESMKKIDGKPFYVITNADELAWFAAQVNGGKTTINAVLNNDIVFGANTTTTSSVEWTPIGIDMDHKFIGVLDGNNFTIYGFMTSDKIKTYGGLVGVLGANGIVKNLNVAKSSVYAQSDAGSIAGVNYGTIENVNTNGTVKSHIAGGVAGTNANTGTIRGCNNTGNVFGGNKTGGLVGHNDGKIVNSTNSGSITNGFTPRAPNWVDETSYGTITAINSGSIDNCVNTGSIDIEDPGSILNLYAGGIGQNNGNINRMWNKANQSITASTNTDIYIGGITGSNSKNITNSRNDGSISAKSGRKTVSTGAIATLMQSGSSIKNSFSTSNFEYWQNNTVTTMTAANMKKDQFAWILNTANGTEKNSGVWSRTDGYPVFADASNKAVFKVVFNDDGMTSNRYTNYKGLVTFPEDPEPAEGYIFSGWYNANDTKVKPTTVFTADQTVKAVYTDASDVFWTINFYNAAPADTLLETKSYQHGSIVTYGGAEPTLAATAKYTYKFKGWDVEPTNAVEDFNYHALYDSTIRSYTIVFNNFDGSKIESATFEYGKMPSCSKTPTRAATAEWKWTHKGWKPALDYVTEDASYTAIYDSVKVEYKVTFMNGVDVVDEQMVPYGDAAVAPTNVTREGCKFVGWNTSFAMVTTALTVKALFEELIIRTVSVVNGDGEKIEDKKVEDGEKYTLPEAPKKDGYTFDAYYDSDKKVGVAGDEVVVSGNVTIIAKYIKNSESSSSVVKSSSSSKPASSSSVKQSSSSVNVESSSNSAKSSSSTKVSSSSSAKVSSSSKAKSSSSSVKSSSSKKSDALIVTAVPKFSVVVLGRNLQIANAKVGATYELFDMQGKVLMQSQVLSSNFNIAVPRSGNYLLKIGDRTQRVTVK